MKLTKDGFNPLNQVYVFNCYKISPCFCLYMGF